MASEEGWPPRSARQALLSSPSGRQKYADYQTGLGPSPIKRSPKFPSLVDRLRLARNNQDHLIPSEVEEEEDEETLQLRLAAIEAKLKLKKLQNKTRKEDELQSNSRPQSATGSSVLRPTSSSHVEVAVSPSRRNILAAEQKSPNRVLLGIDKGVKGADISLRRARTINSSPLKGRHQIGTVHSHPDSRTSATSTARAKDVILNHSIKSFSERMAETRDTDRKQADKRDSARQEKTRSFKLDQKEVEMFKEIAEARSNVRPQSPKKTGIETSRQDISGAVATRSQQHLRKSRTLPDLRAQAEEDTGNSSLFEGFSGLHLSSRILPHTFLKRTLPSEQYKVYRVPDLLKNVTSPAFELPDDVGDFVIFGVIAAKSSPLDHKTQIGDKVKSSEEWEKKWEDGSQNQKKFMVFTITDLKWTIDLYLFDTGLPRYHRLSPGTVIAILNPSIMPPKRGREDTGAFSLALHSGDDTILEIGKASHLGHCSATKKDGKLCGSWVNSAKSEICEWHLNAQVSRTQSGRMGVNAGGAGFGGKGPNSRFAGAGPGSTYPGRSGLRPKEGRGFDFESGAHYYVAASSMGRLGNYDGPPSYRTDVSTARMLDRDDPFIAEGQFSRDQEARLQKRLASQEKERQIAKRLANLGDGSSAGADYMMRRANGDQSLKPRDGRRHQSNSGATGQEGDGANVSATFTGVDLRAEMGRKRPAQDVRLSPVKKKTRFMTSTGIKEAGRESLGPGLNPRAATHDDSDDDDLDIV